MIVDGELVMLQAQVKALQEALTASEQRAQEAERKYSIQFHLSETLDRRLDGLIDAHADARASLAKVRHDCDEMIRVHDEVEKDRDEARAALAKVVDEIADWQDASGLCVPSEERGGDPGGVRPRHLKADLEKRDAELAKAEEENARLREAVYGPVNMEADETLEMRAQRNLAEMRHRLGRAVAAIEALFTPGAGIATAEYHEWPEGKRDDGTPYKKTWNAKLDALHAILSDPTCAQAGEAWRELEECYRLLDVVRGHGMPRGTTYDLQQECDAALAKVAARRGT